MKTMWAPWRMEYIRDDNKAGACVFCRAIDNAEGLTLFAGRRALVVMNKYPYINGHLLVAPRRHVAMPGQLARDEMAAVMVMVNCAIGILTRVMAPEGFNVGMNLGKVAGAGVAEHLHFHIVPRWVGDVNVLTVLGDVRVVPQHLRETYAQLKPHFDILPAEEEHQEQNA